jgi:hypothetical protein
MYWGLRKRSRWWGLLVVLATAAGLLVTPEAVAGASTGDFRIGVFSRDLVDGTSSYSDRFSIPRPGEANTSQRYFNVSYSSGITLTNVRVDLLDDVTGALLQTVTDAAPGGGGVIVPDPQPTSTQSLLVRVTFGDGVTSSINSTPPPTDRIRYRLILTGVDGSGQPAAAQRDSVPLYPLWRMPDAIPRSGVREAGGDDWSSLSTYTWLSDPRNRALVTRIDDIAGEHNHKIGDHPVTLGQNGQDIDMSYPYTFPGVDPAAEDSGAKNYAALTRNTQLAMRGDVAARDRVASWAAQTRARVDDLLAHPDVVSYIWHAYGTAVAESQEDQVVLPRLTSAWATLLIETGKYSNGVGDKVDLGIRDWLNRFSNRVGAGERYHDSLTFRVAAAITPKADVDADGLSDYVEDAVASRFFPWVWFDSGEDCTLPAKSSNPGTVLARVRRHPDDRDKIAIQYVILYQRDCGDLLGVSSHYGDVEPVSITAAPNPACPYGYGAFSVKTVAHEGTGSEVVEQRLLGNVCDWGRGAGGAPSLAKVYSSENKHGTYLSDSTCDGAVGGLDNCSESFTLRFNVYNVGEDGARRIDELSSHQFPAEYAWTDKVFQGGLGPDHGDAGPIRAKWSQDRLLAVGVGSGS